jgi:hypothetical protein
MGRQALQEYDLPRNSRMETYRFDARWFWAYVGQPEVARFIRQAARWRRFFRCCFAASDFRSRSA